MGKDYLELSDTLRSLHLTGAPNARDLGGLKTTDGLVIASGKLIRSGALWRLTDEDITVLKSIPLTTVIDFRTDQEIREKPDLPVPGSKYIRCQILQELSGVTREAGEGEIPPYFQSAMRVGLDAENWMTGLYTPLVENAFCTEHYKRFLHLVLEQDDGALLYHCTVGKDRVGVGTMLLLSALGVDKNTILEDYMLTNLYTSEDRDAAIERGKQFSSDPAVVFAIDAFESVRERYLQNAFDTILRQFGSMDDYLTHALDFDEDKRKRLRRKYLT